MVQPDESPPGRHPEPPADLPQRSLPLVEVMYPMYRLHGRHRDPVHFGQSMVHRFDAPDGSFGVLYAGDGLASAFIETYGRLDTLSRVVTETELARRCLSRIQPSTPLRLVDLTGSGLRYIDADNRLCTGDYRLSQRWSMALYAHPDVVHGIQYRSRHDPQHLCFALFDRVQGSVEVEQLGPLTSRALRATLIDVMNTYGIGLL